MVEKCKPSDVAGELAKARRRGKIPTSFNVAKHLAQFAKPERVGGDPETVECINCGTLVDSRKNFDWTSPIGGETDCCDWPCVVVHELGRESVFMYSLLQYHPESKPEMKYEVRE